MTSHRRLQLDDPFEHLTGTPQNNSTVKFTHSNSVSTSSSFRPSMSASAIVPPGSTRQPTQQRYSGAGTNTHNQNNNNNTFNAAFAPSKLSVTRHNNIGKRDDDDDYQNNNNNNLCQPISLIPVPSFGKIDPFSEAGVAAFMTSEPSSGNFQQDDNERNIRKSNLHEPLASDAHHRSSFRKRSLRLLDYSSERRNNDDSQKNSPRRKSTVLFVDDFSPQKQQQNETDGQNNSAFHYSPLFGGSRDPTINRFESSFKQSRRSSSLSSSANQSQRSVVSETKRISNIHKTVEAAIKRQAAEYTSRVLDPTSSSKAKTCSKNVTLGEARRLHEPGSSHLKLAIGPKHLQVKNAFKWLSKLAGDPEKDKKVAALRAAEITNSEIARAKITENESERRLLNLTRAMKNEMATFLNHLLDWASSGSAIQGRRNETERQLAETIANRETQNSPFDTSGNNNNSETTSGGSDGLLQTVSDAKRQAAALKVVDSLLSGANVDENGNYLDSKNQSNNSNNMTTARRNYENSWSFLRASSKAAGNALLTVEAFAVLRGFFDILDADGSGSLTLDEIEAAAKLIGRHETSLVSAMKIVDKDQSGAIDFGEIVKVFFPTLTLAQISRFERNHKEEINKKMDPRVRMNAEDIKDIEDVYRRFAAMPGGCSFDNMMKSMSDFMRDRPDIVSDVFYLYDKNHDGVLESEEFFDFMKFSYPPFAYRGRSNKEEVEICHRRSLGDDNNDRRDFDQNGGANNNNINNSETRHRLQDMAHQKKVQQVKKEFLKQHRQEEMQKKLQLQQNQNQDQEKQQSQNLDDERDNKNDSKNESTMNFDHLLVEDDHKNNDDDDDDDDIVVVEHTLSKHLILPHPPKTGLGTNPNSIASSWDCGNLAQITMERQKDRLRDERQILKSLRKRQLQASGSSGTVSTSSSKRNNNNSTTKKNNNGGTGDVIPGGNNNNNATMKTKNATSPVNSSKNGRRSSSMSGDSSSRARSSSVASSGSENNLSDSQSSRTQHNANRANDDARTDTTGSSSRSARKHGGKRSSHKHKNGDDDGSSSEDDVHEAFSLEALAEARWKVVCEGLSKEPAALTSTILLGTRDLPPVDSVKHRLIQEHYRRYGTLPEIASVRNLLLMANGHDAVSLNIRSTVLMDENAKNNAASAGAGGVVARRRATTSSASAANALTRSFSPSIKKGEQSGFDVIAHAASNFIAMSKKNRTSSTSPSPTQNNPIVSSSTPSGLTSVPSSPTKNLLSSSSTANVTEDLGDNNLSTMSANESLPLPQTPASAVKRRIPLALQKHQNDVTIHTSNDPLTLSSFKSNNVNSSDARPNTTSGVVASLLAPRNYFSTPNSSYSNMASSPNNFMFSSSCVSSRSAIRAMVHNTSLLNRNKTGVEVDAATAKVAASIFTPRLPTTKRLEKKLGAEYFSARGEFSPERAQTSDESVMLLERIKSRLIVPTKRF